MKNKEYHVANFATIVSRLFFFPPISCRAILVEIILVISNRTRAARSFNFEITRMISAQIALRSVQLPLLIITITIFSNVIGALAALFFNIHSVQL